MSKKSVAARIMLEVLSKEDVEPALEFFTSGFGLWDPDPERTLQAKRESERAHRRWLQRKAKRDQQRAQAEKQAKYEAWLKTSEGIAHTADVKAADDFRQLRELQKPGEAAEWSRINKPLFDEELEREDNRREEQGWSVEEAARRRFMDPMAAFMFKELREERIAKRKEIRAKNAPKLKKLTKAVAGGALLTMGIGTCGVVAARNSNSDSTPASISRTEDLQPSALLPTGGDPASPGGQDESGGSPVVPVAMSTTTTSTTSTTSTSTTTTTQPPTTTTTSTTTTTRPPTTTTTSTTTTTQPPTTTTTVPLGVFNVDYRNVDSCSSIDILLKGPDVGHGNPGTLVLSASGAGSIALPTVSSGVFLSFGISGMDLSGQTVTVSSLNVDGVAYAVNWGTWLVPNC